MGEMEVEEVDDDDEEDGGNDDTEDTADDDDEEEDEGMGLESAGGACIVFFGEADGRDILKDGGICVKISCGSSEIASVGIELMDGFNFFSASSFDKASI